MTDDEIIIALRAERSRLTAVGLAELLDRLSEGNLSQSLLITVFHRAFPHIPLRVLLDSGGWHRVSGGGLSDDEFNQLLNPWLDQAP